MEFYAVIKKNEIMPFAATEKDLEIITLSEVKEKTGIPWYRLYVGSKISDTDEITYKADSQA